MFYFANHTVLHTMSENASLLSALIVIVMAGLLVRKLVK